MTSKAAWLYDNGLEAGEAANMAKYAGAEAASRALDQAIQTHGGNGLASEYGLADYGCDQAVSPGSCEPRNDPKFRGSAFSWIAQVVLNQGRNTCNLNLE